MSHAAKWMLALCVAASATLVLPGPDTFAQPADAGDRGGDRGRGGGAGGGPGSGQSGPGFPGRRDGDGPATRLSGRDWRAASWRDQSPPTPEEWESIVEFMKENSPTRLKLLTRLEAVPTEERRVPWVRLRIAATYRSLERMKDTDPQMYEFGVKQTRIEDEILGTLAQMRRDGETADLNTRLNAQMRSYVDNAMNERTTRLARLKELVAKEETNLNHDREHLEEMMDRQRERFERETKRMLDNDADLDSRVPTTAPADAKP